MEEKNNEKTIEDCLQTEIKDVVTSNINHISDLIEEKIELEQVSLAPVKGSELYPAQVGNEKGSEIAPALTGDDFSSVLYYDALEDDNNDDATVDHDLPPLSENDMENDSEHEDMLENVEKYFKTEELHVSEITIPRVSVNASAHTKVTSDKSSVTESKEILIADTVGMVSLGVLEQRVDNKAATAVLPELCDPIALSNVHQRQFSAHQISKDSDSTVKDIKSCEDSLVQKSKMRKHKKLEIIRQGAILPDQIWLSNHTVGYSMSKKEYNAQCKTLRKSCNMTPKCTAHTSLENLRTITSSLRKVLSQSNNISTDWEKEKKVHSGKYGYLDTATNFPE